MNKRLQEINLSIFINKVDMRASREEYSTIINLLSGIAMAFGKEEHDKFIEFLSKSINKGILGATDKEIIASFMQNGISSTKMAKDLSANYSRFKDRYAQYLDMELDNDYLDSLVPIYNKDIFSVVLSAMIRFVNNIKYPIGNKEHSLKNHNRTLELEFMLIYNKIGEIFGNALLVNKFIFSLCNICNIDFNSINQLQTNIHFIDRSYPNFSYNKRYLKQEITTLYVSKGVGKCIIGRHIFGKASNYLYSPNTKVFGTVISKEDMAWQYIETLSWEHINQEEVQKFIDIFHTIIRFDE